LKLFTLAGLLGTGAWFCLPLVPLPRGLFEPPPAQTELVDVHGQTLRTMREADQSFGRPVTYAEIPQALIHATLAAEDKRFWRHPGVDWRASLRAARDLVWHRRIISGGSTITQQLIKLAKPRPRTFATKAIEAAQALRLEQVWSKQRILAEYLNRIDYGNLNNGCAAAAQFYFGKPLRDLSAAECALLAGLPQAPSRLNPLRNPERARKRQQWILGQMFANGFLTQEEFDRAKAEEVFVSPRRRGFAAPHYVDLLLQFAERDGSLLPRGRIRTTLDLSLNRLVEQTIRRQLAALQSHHAGNAAAVVIDNRSGGVRALVGSSDYFEAREGEVNGAWAPRSAGSTFKPFTYLIAFEQGATPASIVGDVPTEFATSTGMFSPVNYNHHCSGPIRYRLALANSLNIPAVRVLNSIGGAAVLQGRLRECGLTTLTEPAEHYGLGLTIGNAEARLLELANAYACLARLGEFKPYTLVERSSPVNDVLNKVANNALLSPALSSRGGEGEDAVERVLTRRVFGREASILIADILSDNVARTGAFGAQSNLRFKFPVACKTGTSSNFRDNWAFGYTPEFTVGVWLGNFSGEPMQEISGVTGAAPILHEIIEYLHAACGTSWYARPESIVSLPIHPLSGKRLANESERSKTATLVEKFVGDRMPPLEEASDYDGAGRIKLSAEYREWFATSDNSLRAQAVVEEGNANLRILFPQPGTTFYLDSDLPEQGRRVHLRAAGGEAAQWSSPTLQVIASRGQNLALLEKGRHQLTLTDPGTGMEQQTWIEVRDR
jgi:penicillin-binding protein 1C